MIIASSEIENLYHNYQKASKAIEERNGALAARYLHQALKDLEKNESALDPNFYPTMLFHWADLFWSIERPDLVLEVYDQVEQGLPGDPQIALHRAIALFHLARFDEAHDLLSELEDRGYPAADLHFFLGCLTERTGRDATAQSHFRRAATLEPERYAIPFEQDKKNVRETMKRLMDRITGPLRSSFQGARLIFDSLPTEEQLSTAKPRLDPLALTMLDMDQPPERSRRPHVRSVHLFMKNIEKAVANSEELEERLGEALARTLSQATERNEDELRTMLTAKSKKGDQTPF